MEDISNDVVNYEDFNSYLENILADCGPDAPPVACRSTTAEAGEGEEHGTDRIDRGVAVAKKDCDPTEAGSVVSGGITGHGADEIAAVVVTPAAVAKEDTAGAHTVLYCRRRENAQNKKDLQGKHWSGVACFGEGWGTYQSDSSWDNYSVIEPDT